MASSSTNEDGTTNFRLSRGVITGREAIALAALIVGGVIAWASLTGDVKAVGKRQDGFEEVVRDLTRKAAETHDTVLELRVHQRNNGDQLNRIEAIVQGRPSTDRGKP